ncbi:hypothetical protein HK405_002867 [Cladochytrium tenue]|nr:hypothetical protein HK405_002867 [Cladochytrium tenue]
MFTFTAFVYAVLALDFMVLALHCKDQASPHIHSSSSSTEGHESDFRYKTAAATQSSPARNPHAPGGIQHSLPLHIYHPHSPAAAAAGVVVRELAVPAPTPGAATRRASPRGPLAPSESCARLAAARVSTAAAADAVQAAAGLGGGRRGGRMVRWRDRNDGGRRGAEGKERVC